MDIKDITQQLIDSGYSQDRLAKAVAASGVSCTQPMIWRILQGTDPKYSVGEAIKNIYRAEFGDTAAA